MPFFRIYLTVALTALSHFCPAVFLATTAKRWVPADKLMEVVSVVLPGALNFFTPSTHSCVLAMVPGTFAVASTSTGELTLEPLAGRQMWTPSEAGAGHEFETTTKAFRPLGLAMV